MRFSFLLLVFHATSGTTINHRTGLSGKSYSSLSRVLNHIKKIQNFFPVTRKIGLNFFDVLSSFERINQASILIYAKFRPFTIGLLCLTLILLEYN